MEEHENPLEILDKLNKEMSAGYNTIGMEVTTRYYSTRGVQKANIDLKIMTATPVTAGCRGIKTDHEIELIQIANDRAMEVYKVAVTQLKEGMT